MSYEATVEVKISIKEGPPDVKESRKITNVCAANAKRISFKHPDSVMSFKEIPIENSIDKKPHRAICKMMKFNLEKAPQPAADAKPADPCEQKNVPEDERLAFVAIKASKYIYKQCVNVDVGGVGYRLGGCSSKLYKDCDKIEWMVGDRVVLNVCGALDLADSIELFVDEKLFDCSKKDQDEIIVTVTFGVLGSDSMESDGTVPCCNDTAEVASGRNQRHLARV